MPSTNSQTGPSPDDGNIAAFASQHHRVLDDDQEPPEGFENYRIQKNEQEDSRGNEQAGTAELSKQDPPQAPTSAPIVLSELALHPPTWPADGFADDDPAIAHMVAIMQSLEAQPPTPTALEEIIFLPTTDPKERRDHPFEQLLRRRMTDGANHNFFLPLPDNPEVMVGKVDGSMAGLAVITEALRAVATSYGETVPVVPLSQHVDRLNAANGAMHFVTPTRWDRIYYSLDRPFTPEGIRTTAAALQVALRSPASDCALFYAYELGDPSFQRTMALCLEVYGIAGWGDQ